MTVGVSQAISGLSKSRQSVVYPSSGTSSTRCRGLQRRQVRIVCRIAVLCREINRSCRASRWQPSGESRGGSSRDPQADQRAVRSDSGTP